MFDEGRNTISARVSMYTLAWTDSRLSLLCHHWASGGEWEGNVGAEGGMGSGDVPNHANTEASCGKNTIFQDLF